MEVYLDNAASTPVDPRVAEAMRPYFAGEFGNASSLHAPGRRARAAIEEARAAIAAAIGAERPEEVVFTSGGTESNNLAIKGVAFASRKWGRHLVSSAVEHDCVINSLRWLEEQGFSVTYLPVDPDGLVRPADLAAAIRPDTVLVSVMHANHEIGTVEPVRELARICADRGVPFHTDACQSFGKLPIDARRDGFGLVTLNAHKIHGPKGVGALYIRRGTRIDAWQHGGGHEFGLRSSTENVPGIVGFAEAARICGSEGAADMARLGALRDRIIDSVLRDLPGAYLNGHRRLRLPTNINTGFHGLEGEAITLLLRLDEAGIAVATGSACSSHQGNRPSHVLTAIGRDPVQARGALRITLGRFNTAGDVNYLLDKLGPAVESLRPITGVR